MTHAKPAAPGNIVGLEETESENVAVSRPPRMVIESQKYSQGAESFVRSPSCGTLSVCNSRMAATIRNRSSATAHPQPLSLESVCVLA
jgi:hypothetical protein